MSYNDDDIFLDPDDNKPLMPQPKRQSSTPQERQILNQPRVRRQPFQHQRPQRVEPLTQLKRRRELNPAQPLQISQEESGYDPPRPTTGQLIKRVKDADPSDIRQVAAALLELNNRNYHHVLRQAQQSFNLALVAGTVGLFFLLAAVSFFFLTQPTNISFISLISGSLVETISAINFYIYGRASKQFEALHTYLDRINRSLIADSLCEKIINVDARDTSRAELIKTITRDILPLSVNQRDFVK